MAKTEQVEAMGEVDARVYRVGVDDGHNGIKIVTEDGRAIHVPSRVVSAGDLIALGDSGENIYQTTSGSKFAVSASLPYVDTTFADYATSEINRVLVHHGLVLAGLGGKRVSIVTGLPVEDYYVANKPNQIFIDRKVANLVGSAAAVSNANPAIQCARIESHRVVSEGIAAFFDLLFDDEGNERETVVGQVERGAIAFVDIGGKTTDTAVLINGGRSIDARRSGTDRLGALSLHRAVENALKAKHNLTSLLPSQVDGAVSTGKVRFFGQDVDCVDVIETEKTRLASQIIEAMNRKLRDGSDLEAVYFVGGGAALLRKQLEGLYPHAIFVEDPQFANARGMLKAAKFVHAS
ncbi:ParM/StbA family protein [Pandoraea communis]|uniref:ParM/StbA family protein n=1 Tax=Pandoraea communis TaxID=2508297 RepID=UPI0025A56BB3|nr:ParM/StbA family protein [Pandoraea communis]MDM8356524.1 ParM/StbA family protein [Pandoraea communis]